MRYFVNKLKDLASGQSIEIPGSALQDRVKSIVTRITENITADQRNCDGGLYVGISGISYTLWYISQCSHFQDTKDDLLRQAKAYVEVADAYETHHQDKMMGQSFLLGTAGVCSVGALVHWSSGDAGKAQSFVKRYSEFAARCQPVAFLSCGSDELFVGRAGYLAGTLMLAKRMGTEVLKPEEISSICASMVESGRQYARRNNSPAPLMYAYYKTEYLGVVYVFAKAYQIWKDQSYLDACHTSAEIVWNKGLLKKGPGICHGVAGSGYVFLLLYRLTKDPKYLHRAVQFAEFMESDEFKQGARTPDCPYSLFEGLAGTACFLVDLLQPEIAEFPLFDVF